MVETLPISYPLALNSTPVEFAAVAFVSVAIFTADLVNNNTCDGFAEILPNSEIKIDIRPDFHLGSEAIRHSIDFALEGYPMVIGYPVPESSVSSAFVGTVYEIAQISSFAPSSALSDDLVYPYFTKISGTSTAATMNNFLVSQQEKFGIGWTDVALITSIESVAIDFSLSLISIATDLTFLSFQQFLSTEIENIDNELSQIVYSGANIIVVALFDSGDYFPLLEKANEYGLVGEEYVWMVNPSISAVPNPDSSPLARGTLAVLEYAPTTTRYTECFSNAWANADPFQYPASGTPISGLHKVQFDLLMTSILSYHEMDKQEKLDGRKIPVTEWVDTIRTRNFEGLSGDVVYDEAGERVVKFSVNYYDPTLNQYILSSIWNPDGSIEPNQDIVWFSGTTEVPDLDIRPPFSYWSCYDGEIKEDPTGKTVSLQTPDGSNINEIESHYHCDQFVDCQNLSDEINDCWSNYLVLYIVFGVITGVLMLIVIALIIFVIIFGFVLEYRRLRTSSPLFLLFLLVSIFIGYSSIFTFFGKPHPVSCAFQPWILGLPSIAVITSLTVKNFRLWRIFQRPGRVVKISDLKLFALWWAIMIPGIFIVALWTLISTPTASMQERNGEDHYICYTGGFTGSPGGYVFFSIFVVYSALVLVLGAIISILTRNLPSMFNESKLQTISIYNLGFLSVVLIPVVIILQSNNPFYAWIVRAVAILYAFTATLFIQFIPKVVGVFLIDKCKNVKKFSSLALKNKDNSSNSSSRFDSHLPN